MDKIKRFIDFYIPVESCTLRCHYCYITHHRLFDNKLPDLKYSAQQVRRALSLKRMGGPCLINMCGGGETLLPPLVVEYIRQLLEEGHYVSVVTNATASKRFEQIAQFPHELLERLFFKFSYHYLELKERNLLDTFFRNVKLMRDAGASFTLEATPSDELIPFISEMKTVAIDNVGAACHVTVARDEREQDDLPILSKYPRDEYKKIWDSFDSEFFRFKLSIFGVKRREFCYAGSWSFWLDGRTGNMSQCYCSHFNQNIMDNPDKPIHFIPVGNNCNQYHCYNGHAFLTFGNIPELKTQTYAELRNRICKDGSEWLRPQMKSFMSTRLYDSNVEYGTIRKLYVNIFIKVYSIIRSFVWWWRKKVR